MNNEIFNSVTDSIAKSVTSKRAISMITTPFSGGQLRDALSKMNLDSFDEYLCDLGEVSEGMLPQMSRIMADLSEGDNHIPLFIDDVNDIDIDLSLAELFVSPTFIANAPVHTDIHSHIGLQKHYIGSLFDSEDNKHLRLGALKNDIQKAEVLLRSADYISINLNVLRRADNIGNQESTTAGLCIEDLCLIAKYAGASTHLKAILIKGYNRDKDHMGMMAENVALINWYLMEGYMLRQRELNAADTFKKYTVFTEDLEHELHFSQNVNTDRWWVSIHSDEADEHVEFACTKNDYESACQNEISERVLSLMAKV